MFLPEEKNKIPFYTVPAFSATGLVRHGFSNRVSGVSTEKRPEEFTPLCDAVGIMPQHLVLTKQTHSANCVAVTSADCGRGITRDLGWSDVDGLMTDEPNVALCAFFADCVPLLLLDPVKKAIAAVHSGWRGVYRNILQNAVDGMRENYHTNPSDLLLAIGPSIGPESFAVGDDLATQFAQKFGEDVVIYREQAYVDLWKTVMKEAVFAGISEEKITCAGLCTVKNADTFCSYRAEGEKAGRMIAIMELMG